MSNHLKPLRPHQTSAIDLLKASLRSGHRCPVLQLSTGAGKTVIAAHIVAGARAKQNRVTFTVPSIGLVDQTFDRFAENGIDPVSMGVIQADHPWSRPHAPVQIATVQSLARRSERPDSDVVVVDEAHIQHECIRAWMADCGYSPKIDQGRQSSGFGYPPSQDTENGRVDPENGAGNDGLVVPRRRPIFIGLTATPWSRGMGRHWDDLIKPVSMQELIDGGYLSKFRVFAPTHPDLSGVKTRAGDYAEGQLSEAMNRPELTADIVTTWLARAEGRPTLCFAVDRKHAAALHERFVEAGVPCAYVDAFTPREERDRIGRALASGDLKIAVNIGTLTTGIDWDIRCISLCRPTKSESLFVQIIGRGLRPAPGKDHCLILDHSDTHLRLGMVTDIDHDELDDGRPKPKAETKNREKSLPLPRECQCCGCLIPALVKSCHNCGAEMKLPGPVEGEGELTELVPGVRRRFQPSKSATVELLEQMGKPEIIGQLYTLRDERGRSDGWVAHTYRDIFGVWPRGLDRAPPRPVSALLRGWVKHRAIAWSKSQQRSSERIGGLA